MPKRLVNPTIKFISILTDETKPANGKPVLIKGAQYKEICKATVTKNEPLKGELYFTATISNENDTDDETYFKSDTRFSQRDLMKNLNSVYGLADNNHDMQPREKVWLAESTITDGNGLMVKGEDEKYDKIAFEGCYNYSEDEFLMQKAKEGKITGVSIYGWVEAKEEVGKLEKMVYAIYDKLFGKAENKSEVTDMKKELEDFLKSDEGLKELEEMGFKKETPAEPEPEVTEEETPEAPEEPKEDVEKALTEKAETLTAELTKAQELIKQLEADKAELIKMKKGSTVEDAGDPKLPKVTKAQYDEMDMWDKHNFSLQYPELVKQYNKEQ